MPSLHINLYAVEMVALALVTITTESVPSVEVAFEVDPSTTCERSGLHIAQLHGCKYKGQVGSLKRDCLMDCSKHHANLTSKRKSGGRYRRDLRVIWFQEQIPHKRVKRDFLYDSIQPPKSNEIFTDKYWKNMWYLNRNQQYHNQPDHNVTVVWQMGYTGKGVVITFLDDGLEYDHPDLRANYDPLASIDVNSDDADPSPRYDAENNNRHGTRCAGEVAAVANNSLCIVGVAYDAKIGGIRMLDGDVSDSVEAKSLSHRPDHVHIYSASWGPDDDGKSVDGPGKLAKDAFKTGAREGRNGKGSIFVWASGNGGKDGDSCACDGYVNSIYTFAISATTEVGDKPWYQEECAGTLATTYSSGDNARHDRAVVTTDLLHSCTHHHTGTSASAPLAAAFIALVLEARPDLTWRDVMYICVLGSRPEAIDGNTDYVTNKAGFKASTKYGFGLMDAGLMVHLALGWSLVAPMISCQSNRYNVPKRVLGLQIYSSTVFFGNCYSDHAKLDYIEQVHVVVSVRSDLRGSLELYIISPMGTRSKILPVSSSRKNDRRPGDFTAWPLLSLQFWGEYPVGEWTLELVNTDIHSSELHSWYLIVYGTKSNASRLQPRSPSSCNIYCDDRARPCGPDSSHCSLCRHAEYRNENGQKVCLAKCPVGYYVERDKRCLRCHPSCQSCVGPRASNCTSCVDNLLLVVDKFECRKRCPRAYLSSRFLVFETVDNISPLSDLDMRKCIKCANGCRACHKYTTICMGCLAGYTITPKKSCVIKQNCSGLHEYFDPIEQK
ncbi:hypothetical protein ACOME3_009500 [Neoechinorhynchus agilis]